MPRKLPEFDPDPALPGHVWARMADHLAARMQAGQLTEGVQLPGERDLADEYGVAVGTVRRAIEELSERGLVVTVPAKGTFVADLP